MVGIEKLLKLNDTAYIVVFVLRLAAFATFILGMVTLFVPGLVGALFGGSHTDNFHFVRFVGAALIGFSVLNWFTSHLKNPELVRPVIYGNFVSLAVAVGVDIIGLSLGTFAPATWLSLLLHIVFAGLFAYCILILRWQNPKGA